MRLYNGVRLLDRPSPANIRRLDLGCLPMIAEMHRSGIRVDVPYMRALSEELLEERDRVGEEIDCLAERELNPNSGLQVASLLFDQWRVQADEPLKMVPSRARQVVNDEVLSMFRDRHPVIPLILDWRELDKLNGTYAAKMPRMVRSDERIHARFNATQTATGRLSCEDPNLQNIPIRGKWGKKIRNGFIASPGCALASCDLSQIEMVVGAHVSGDYNLRRVFIEGRDIHVSTACAIYKILAEQVDKLLHRLPSKTLNYQIFYGVTAPGLRDAILLAMRDAGVFDVIWTVEDCERFIGDWFGQYPGVREWLELQAYRARRYGMVWDMFGRWRLVPEVRSALQGIINAGLRQCGNMPIQSGAQGVIKLAMAELTPIVEHYRSYDDVICRPLLQIHDELVFELSRNVAEEFCYLTRGVLETVVPLAVPVRSSSDIAERWGDLK